MSDYPGWCAFVVSFLALVPLVALAGRRPIGHKVAWVILSLSAVLVFVTVDRDAKLILLGGDYSYRLYVSIGVNMWADLMLGIFLAVTRRWIAVVAAATLALAWLFIAAVNSTV